MHINDAIRLVRDHDLACSKAMEAGRSPVKAYRTTQAIVRTLLRELTGDEPTDAEVEQAMV